MFLTYLKNRKETHRAEAEWMGEQKEVRLNERVCYCKIMVFTLNEMGS